VFFKIVAVVALVILPLNISFWHRSYKEPMRYRWDATPYKSLTVYLHHGVFGTHILTMPTLTAIRSESTAALRSNAIPNNASFLLTSSLIGPYRHTWIAFPLWLPAGILAFGGALPIVQGPLRRYWRQKRGLCTYCGYDLRGTRSGVCPECGQRYKASGAGR
jgi:hypothetical protein